MIIFLKMINYIFHDVVKYLKRVKNQYLWRELNCHNRTTIHFNTKDFSSIEVGNHSYGELIIESFGNEGEKLIIGNFVSIAKNVLFILGGNHQIKTFTSYPINTMLLNRDIISDSQTKGPIVVEDEVWIGTGVIILSGTRIGKGSILGAGSVITKDVAPFSIVGGNPAKFIKWRYEDEIIIERNKIDLSDLNMNVIIENSKIFYEPLSNLVLSKVKKLKT